MSRRNGANRAAFPYLVMVLFIFFSVVALFSSKKSSAFESAWISVATENAGLLSLPAEWMVISRDEATERSPGEGFAFNVQQVLYAEPEGTSTDLGASLQVFSIWNSDPEGRVASLPPEILEQAGEDLVGGLINVRYGHVRQLNRNMLKTHFDDIPVTTWSTDASETSDVRYKCVALFHGEKLVLVLGRYLPDYETLWSKQFDDIVNRWVSSQALTPGPMPEALMAAISLPDMTVAALSPKTPATTQTLDIVSIEDAPAAAELSSDISSAVAAVAVETPSEEGVLDGLSPLYYGVPSLLAVLVFGGMLVGKIAGKHRSHSGRLSSFQDIVPVPITPEELTIKKIIPSSSSLSSAVTNTPSPDFDAAETSATPEPEETSTDVEVEMKVEEALKETEAADEIQDEYDDEFEPPRSILMRCGLGIKKLFSFTGRVPQELDEDTDEVGDDPDIDVQYGETPEEKKAPINVVFEERPTEEKPAIAKPLSDWRETAEAPLLTQVNSENDDESLAVSVEPVEKCITGSQEEALPEKAACMDSPEDEKEEKRSMEEPEAEKNISSHPFDRIRPEDMELPPLSSTYDDPSHPSVWEETPTTTETLVQSVPEEAGFEKVYTLINQALDILESYKDVMPAPRYYSNMPETPATPSVPLLREKTKNVVEKESPNVSAVPVDAGESQFDLMAETPDPYGLKWLYICAFALMTIADVTVAALAAQISNAELLLSQLLESIPVLLENDFILMGASCLLALGVRFAILRHPMHRGGLHLLVSTLSVAFGTSAFALGTLFSLSILPHMGIMQGCALAVSFYLSYRTLIYRSIDDVEEEHAAEDPATENPETAVNPQEQTTSHKEMETDDAEREEEFIAVSIQHSDDLFKELETSFGTSYVLDLLEDEVHNAMENEKGSLQLIRARDIAPDCPILKLCCSTLINLMQTGRYHIGHGILSSEGQELLNLFAHITGRLLRSGYSTSEELRKDLDLMQRCVQERG